MDATKAPTHYEAKSSPTERQARYLAEHTRCAMCESELEMGHEIDPSGGVLKEEAHCPTCCVRVRAIRHRVH